jgi:hypothetical protein
VVPVRGDIGSPRELLRRADSVQAPGPATAWRSPAAGLRRGAELGHAAARLRPRRPTQTPLYPIVQHHVEMFLAQAAEGDTRGEPRPRARAASARSTAQSNLTGPRAQALDAIRSGRSSGEASATPGHVPRVDSSVRVSKSKGSGPAASTPDSADSARRSNRPKPATARCNGSGTGGVRGLLPRLDQ